MFSLHSTLDQLLNSETIASGTCAKVLQAMVDIYSLSRNNVWEDFLTAYQLYMQPHTELNMKIIFWQNAKPAFKNSRSDKL